MNNAVADESVTAELKYLLPSDETPVYYASEGGKEAQLELSGEFETRRISITDARYQQQKDELKRYSLDREGFTFTSHAVSIANFYDESEIKKTYLPEAENLVKNITGASRVLAFDATFRSDAKDVREVNNSREPSTVVHNDYTARSAPQRVRDILGDETASDLLKRRFSIVNVWRPLKNPVLTSPLAVCDAQSVEPEDLVAVERHAKDRIGELLLANYNPKHKWYYFKRMQADEALLIKTFDSLNDGSATSCIHTAFLMPDTPENVPPRESIEVRLFVFY